MSDFATLRTMLAEVKRAAGETVDLWEDRPQRGSMVLHGIGWEPKSKLYTDHPRTRPGEVIVHVTGVRGGFGVSGRRAVHWKHHLQSEPDSLFAALVRGVTDPELCLALFERFATGTPYHTASLRNGDVVQTHPIELRTHHAGPGGNDGSGWVLDCHPGEPLTASMVATGRAGLRLALQRERAFARSSMDHAGNGRVVVLPHAAVTQWPRRAADPGRAVTREIVVPVVRSLDWVEMGTETRQGGRIPDWWPPQTIEEFA